MANLKESQIERNMVKRVRERGGLCYKFQSPGNPGVPDRIILTREGHTVYVELKTEIGRLAKIQVWQIGEMRKRGADVRVVRGADEMRALVDELFPMGAGA
ncbi:MAG: VRR-NUC domain-containing protein [Acutalibacteraceae bacterium]